MRSTVLLAVLIVATCGCRNTRPRVIIDTPMGEITAVIETEKAKLTSQQFLKNVDNEVYSNERGSFYRVVRMDNQPDSPVKIEVIQGGIDRNTGDLETPYIPHETTRDTGILHRNGTLSMAREEPGTANTEIFICIGKQPELDFGGKRNPDGKGFAAFGQITSGMNVVRKIQQLKESDQYLDQPVPILSIRRKL